MRQYCCLKLEDAVIRGWIKEEVFVEARPEKNPQHNVFIAEFVINKRKTKHWLIYDKDEISIKEIILKNCLFCGRGL